MKKGFASCSRQLTLLLVLTGKSQNSKVGIVLGIVGGVILLLVVGIICLICKSQRKGYRREEFVDVPGLFPYYTSAMIVFE